MRSSAFRISCGTALFSLLLCCGCGDGDPRPDLQSVTGKLIINGQPATGAVLVFHPAEGQEFDSRGSRPRARVDEDGIFQLTTYQSGDGAPAGDYQVAILWFDNPDSSKPWNKLGKQYANPQDSEVNVTIKGGNNLLPPIEIENVQLTKRPAQKRQSRDVDQLDD